MLYHDCEPKDPFKIRSRKAILKHVPSNHKGGVQSRKALLTLSPLSSFTGWRKLPYVFGSVDHRVLSLLSRSFSFVFSLHLYLF